VIDLRTLGPAEILVDGKPAPRELLWRKNLALLLYLSRSPDGRRSREHLIGMLWGDKPDSSARHSLNEALRVIRRSTGDGLLESAGDQVLLSRESVTVDSDMLEANIADEDWEAAAALVRGPFLEGFAVPDSSLFEDWLAAERVRWTDRCGEALRRHAETRLARGDTQGAHEAAARALALDPFSDAAVRLTMLAAALRGERAAALAAFDGYAGRLSEELGIAPEPETDELAGRIRSERTFKLPETVPESELWARRLPLVGREDELEAAIGAFREGVVRGGASLVMVQAESGAGKTRLAEEVASRARLEGAATTQVRAVPTDRESAWSAIAGLSAGLLGSPESIRVRPAALAAILPHATFAPERLATLAEGSEPAPLGQALTDLVRAVARRQPVLAWIDGAGYLDDESGGALHAILRDLEDVPFTLLLTSGTYPPNEQLDQLRARVGRDVPGVAMTLDPLAQETIEELAAVLLPELGDEERRRLGRRIHLDSAGLPLFAVELLNAVRLGLELEDLAGWPRPFQTMDQTYPGDLPDSVVAAIRIGYRRLSKPAQQVLAAASVLGDRLETALLARAPGLDEETLHGALDELEWNRWLAAEQRGYVFVARIVRDVVAQDMLTAGQRQRILDAVAR
jgi:DNA-binding SARP family transcriptional activator